MDILTVRDYQKIIAEKRDIILFFTSCVEGNTPEDGARAFLTEFAQNLLICFEVQCERTPAIGYEYGIKMYPTICVILSGVEAMRIEGWDIHKLMSVLALGNRQER